MVPALSLCVFVLAGCATDAATGARPDQEGPEIRVTAPAEGGQVHDPDVVLQGTLADSTGLSSMWVEVNGRAGDTTRFAAAPRQVAFGVTLIGLRVGNNSVRVLARDVRGNVGTRSFGLAYAPRDVTPPRLVVLAPGTEVTVSVDSVRITGRATDDVGVRSIRYSVDGGAEMELSITPDTAVSFAFTVSALPVGGNTIRIVARDAAGGTGTVVVSAARRPPPYTLTPLGTFGGGGSAALGVNESGEVVGWAQNPANSLLPFVWRGGALTRLAADGESGTAGFVNDAGMVAGTTYVTYPATRVRVWTDGATRVLPIDSVEPVASGINGRGDVVGHTNASTPDTLPGTAFVWRNGSVAYLGVDAGAVRSRATGINDRGQVVGTLYFEDRGRSAFLWENGRFTLLFPRGTRSAAVDVNEHGHVLVERPNSEHIIWEPTRTRAVEGMGRPQAMNDHGHVVGEAGGVNVPTRGVLWIRGKAFDLTSLLPDSSWTVLTATGINNRGQITGSARNQTTGKVEAVLLTPASR